MQKFDILILKRNINDLLRDKGTTQQQLADALGMSQSNVSKALSEKDKKCFTVEQIFGIADFFGVSIDWLLGFETAQKMATGPRATPSLKTAPGAPAADPVPPAARSRTGLRLASASCHLCDPVPPPDLPCCWPGGRRPGPGCRRPLAVGAVV